MGLVPGRFVGSWAKVCTTVRAIKAGKWLYTRRKGD